MATAVAVLFLVYVMGSIGIMGNPVLRFPQIQHSLHLEVKIQSVMNENFVFIRVTDSGSSYGTKALTSQNDPEVEFIVHVYRVPQRYRNALVLPEHSASHAFLQMSSEKRVEVVSAGNNLPDFQENMEEADSRFFYMKRADDDGHDIYVLEGTNGADSGYYLAVNGTELTFVKPEGDLTVYPREILFKIIPSTPESTTNAVSNEIHEFNI